MFGSIIGSAHLPFLAICCSAQAVWKPGHLPAIGALTHGVRLPALRTRNSLRLCRPQVLELPGHSAYVAEATREFMKKRRKNDQQQPRVCNCNGYDNRNIDYNSIVFIAIYCKNCCLNVGRLNKQQHNQPRDECSCWIDAHYSWCMLKAHGRVLFWIYVLTWRVSG